MIFESSLNEPSKYETLRPVDWTLVSEESERIGVDHVTRSVTSFISCVRMSSVIDTAKQTVRIMSVKCLSRLGRLLRPH